MNQETHLSNISLVEKILKAGGPYCSEGHSTFGRIFQFSFVPCCIPLNAVLWVNPDSNGIFTRSFFPVGSDAMRSPSLYTRLNDLNYTMPVGSLVINSTNGQLIFQNAIFIGDAVVAENYLWQFLAASCDMVSYRFTTLMELATGTPHVHADENG